MGEATFFFDHRRQIIWYLKLEVNKGKNNNKNGE